MRHVSTAILACSLLLATATVALWIRSYWTSDALLNNNVWSQPRASGWRVVGVISNWGVIKLATDGYRAPKDDDGFFPRQGPPSWDWELYPPSLYPRPDRNLVGIPIGIHSSSITPPRGLVVGTQPLIGVERSIWAPHWLIALLVATPAFLIVWRRCIAARRARRIAAGQCADCGYDLRASPERCPECGAPAIKTIPSTTAAAV